MRRNISIKEYEVSESIALTDEQVIYLRQFDTVLDLLAGAQSGQYRIRASSWVGTILTPGLALHIEPKIGAVDVLKMLLLGDGEANPRDIHSLTKSTENIWDLMGIMLSDEISKLAAGGLNKAYVAKEDNLSSPMGQINFMQDFLANTPVRRGIFCNYDEFTNDIPKNQALAWALHTLNHLVSPEVTLKIRWAESFLEGVSNPPEFPSITLPGQNDPYRMSLFLAELLRRFQGLGAAKLGKSGAGYLLNMNDIFEGYVRQRLRIELQGIGLKISDKGHFNRNLCEGVKLEPDIIIHDINWRPIIIADCKYKRDWDNNNSDVYQMLAYLEGFRPVNTALVIHPESQEHLTLKKTPLPRDRILISIGLPQDQFLDDSLWAEINQRLIAILSDNQQRTVEAA